MANKRKASGGKAGGAPKLNIAACIAAATNIVMGFQKSSAAKKAEGYAKNAESEVQRLYSASNPNDGVLLAMDDGGKTGDGIVNETPEPSDTPQGGLTKITASSNNREKEAEEITIPAEFSEAFQNATGVALKDYLKQSVEGDVSADQLAQAAMAKAAPDQASSLSAEYAALAAKLGDQKIDPSLLSLNENGKLSYGGLTSVSSNVPDLQSTLAGLFGKEDLQAEKSNTQPVRGPASVINGQNSKVSSLFRDVSRKYMRKLQTNEVSVLPWATHYNRGVNHDLGKK